jgi:hypothetical protein
MADAKQAAVSRRKFLSTVADTHTLILPIHFPTPTAGLVTQTGTDSTTGSNAIELPLL